MNTDASGHGLRTFFNGSHGGTCWECWCGETSQDAHEEFIDQAFARHDHDRHQTEREAD